jgi:hypothetical protein
MFYLFTFMGLMVSALPPSSGILNTRTIPQPPLSNFVITPYWQTVEVEVTLRLTVRQSVVKVSSPFWDLVLPSVRSLLSCLCGAPSLTRGRVCHSSFSVHSNLPVFTSSVYVIRVLQFSNLYAKLLSVPSVQQIMPY